MGRLVRPLGIIGLVTGAGWAGFVIAQKMFVAAPADIRGLWPLAWLSIAFSVGLALASIAVVLRRVIKLIKLVRLERRM